MSFDLGMSCISARASPKIQNLQEDVNGGLPFHVLDPSIIYHSISHNCPVDPFISPEKASFTIPNNDLLAAALKTCLS